MKIMRMLDGETWQAFKANRRLQIGVLLIIMIILFEVGARWVERLSVQRQQLQQLRAELVAVRAQSRNKDALRTSLQEFDRARQVIDAKIWPVSSEAVAQARLNEWLGAVLKRAGVVSPVVRLTGARPLAEEDARGAGTSAGGAGRLQEFRAVVRYAFTPETLEKVLAEIESGEAMAAIESLTVNKRERRVEFSVRVMMLVGGQQTDAVPSDGVATPGGQ